MNLHSNLELPYYILITLKRTFLVIIYAQSGNPIMNMYTKLVLPTDEGNATTRLGGLVGGPYESALARMLLDCSTNSHGLGLYLA